MKEFAMAHPGEILVVLLILGWLVAHLLDQVTIWIRGYEPDRPDHFWDDDAGRDKEEE